MKEESCWNCNTIIGTEEQAYVFKGTVVCGRCYEKLKRPSDAVSRASRSRLKIRLVATSVLLALAFFAYLFFFCLGTRLKVREVPLGESDSLRAMVSSSGKQVAFIERRPEQGNVLIVDGEKRSEVVLHWLDASFEDENFLFSPDEKRFMFIPVDGLLIRDGEEVQHYVQKPLLFSPDSKHYAYAIRDGEYSKVVRDGIAGKGYSRVNGMVFSPDSKSLAYRASSSPGVKFIVVDDVEGEKYEEVGNPTFFPATGQVVYAAKRAEKSLVVVGDTEGREYDDIGQGFFAFSPDGERLAYAARRGRNWLLVVDCVEGKEYHKVGQGSIFFSPDSKRLAYGAERGGKWFVVVDGMEVGGYEGAGGFIFSPDSKRVAYAARRGQKWFGVVDGIEGKGYDGIKELVFSQDSKRVVYGAKRGQKWLMVVDGIEGEEYDSIKYLAFSPDSKRVAYAANIGRTSVQLREDDYFRIDPLFPGDELIKIPSDEAFLRMKDAGGKWFVIIDGHKGKEYDDVESVTLIPNGERIVYFAEENLYWRIVVDDRETAEYHSRILDAGLPNETRYHRFIGIFFDSPTQFHTFAQRGGTLFRVEVEVIPGWLW